MTREALGRLCRGGGWTYAALWLFDSRDPRLLVLEGSYHEEQSVMVFEKMIGHVHVIDQGTIGTVTISGKHRWINFEESSAANPNLFQSNAEWQVQVLAGIKTVAVIPLPSFGVVQFGSIQKIRESSDFIAEALNLPQQLQIKQHGNIPTDLNFQAAFSSTVYTLDSSRFKNNVSSHYSFYKQGHDNGLSTECSVPATTSCAYGDHDNLLYVTPNYNFTSSYQDFGQEEVFTKPENLLPCSNTEIPSKLKFPSNLCSISSKNHIRAREINSYMDHQLFPCMGLPGLLNMIPLTLHSSIPDIDTCNLVSENLFLSHSKGGSKAMLDNGILSSSKISTLTTSFPENLLISSQDRNNEISTSINELTNHHILDKSMNSQIHSLDISRDRIKNISDIHIQLVSDRDDLFDNVELDPSSLNLRQECWDDLALPFASASYTNLSTRVSDCLPEFTVSSVAVSDKEFFTDSSSLEQLLDAVIAKDANISTSCNSVTSLESKHHISSITELSNAQITPVPFVAQSSFVQTPADNPSEFNIEKTMQGSSSREAHNLWMDDSCSVIAESSAFHLPMKQEESGKVHRKRARPGESARPKPKDRQQIQDRVKELREIVPNGAKCSIDALLDRTIKHMLYLQSVTKYADKVKQVDETELIREESGVVLKDNTNGGVGGATWAYEVAGQTMVCPILVEDVHPSGHMVVEMLCEERGLFLEIADVVRGFGLTILKGVMEIRERKLWSRFLVEANRDVTRMDIFLSLVQLLHQASGFGSPESYSKSVAEGSALLPAYRQRYPVPIPIGLDERLL